jgi:demethylmenaquinone methyltransferase/2-methoxy-6-polyprenyl-1,4-benzoquinol methylase
LESAELVDYYRRRAGEYEAIYAKPERQADLAILRKRIPERLGAGRILEVACGTGYWTEVIACSAASVTATDLAEEPMRIARAKVYERSNVVFQAADAYALPETLGRFDAAFAGFWWSHVPRERIADFVRSLHARLKPGARVLLLDNRYVEGNSTPLASTDAAGNTYQDRRLGDGSVTRIVKNFPRPAEVRDLFGASLVYREFEYYWLAEYQR